MSSLARIATIALATSLATLSWRAAAGAQPAMLQQVALRQVALQHVALQQIVLQPAAAREAGTPRVDLTIANLGSIVSIRASVIVACNPETAWKVLTDYGGYASFIPSVETSRVVERDGMRIVVEQTDLAPPWLLRMPVEVVYRITEYPPTRIVSRASFDGGDTLDSEYRLTAEPRGMRLDYAGRLTARRGMLEWLHEKAGARAIGEQIQALAREMERAARGSGSRDAELTRDVRH